MSKHDVWTEGDRSHYVDYVMVERIANARRKRETWVRMLNAWARRSVRPVRRPLPDRRAA